MTKDAPAEGKTHEDFDAGASGDMVADQFDGFSVTGQRADDADSSENDAMLFDTANTTGGDSDLGFANQGNAILLSEENGGDDADDNAGGDTLHVTFDEDSDVQSATMLDIEEPGRDSDLFDVDGALISFVPVPATGDNTGTDVEIDVTGVAMREVTLARSGAVDDLSFSTPEDAVCTDNAMTYNDMMVAQNGDQTKETPEETDNLMQMAA